MSRFVYTIIFFVVFSGFSVWFVINNYKPTGILIVLVCVLFFICFGLICSLFSYLFNIKKSKIIFPYEYKKIYRKGLFNSFLISLLPTLLLIFQLLQVLDLITLILLIVFFLFIGILRSGKLRSHS